MEHAPSSLRAEAREMVSRGIASSQGRKLKGESEEGEHQGGCAGHRRVLAGRRSGGKGNGEERKGKERWGLQSTAHRRTLFHPRSPCQCRLPSCPALFRSGLSEILPAPAKIQLKLFSRASFHQRVQPTPSDPLALNSGTVIVPSWSRPRTRLRAKSFLPRKQHEQGIVAPIG